MSRISFSNKTSLGLAAIALAGGMSLASSAAFAVEALPQGYQLASAEKAGEGKCGEGKCGDASFARTDTDDDGRVSLKELLAVAPNGGEDFKAIDTNKDGYLSEAETYKYRSNQYTSNGKKVPADLFPRLSKAQD
ncbi:HvfA family oxazolone/thioamide-modified RiPP metallophore [Pseudomonas lini]